MQVGDNSPQGWGRKVAVGENSPRFNLHQPQYTDPPLTPPDPFPPFWHSLTSADFKGQQGAFHDDQCFEGLRAPDWSREVLEKVNKNSSKNFYNEILPTGGPPIMQHTQRARDLPPQFQRQGSTDLHRGFTAGHLLERGADTPLRARTMATDERNSDLDEGDGTTQERDRNGELRDRRGSLVYDQFNQSERRASVEDPGQTAAAAHAPSQVIRPPPVSPPLVHQRSLSSDAFGPAATASDLPPHFPPQRTAARDHQTGRSQLKTLNDIGERMKNDVEIRMQVQPIANFKINRAMIAKWGEYKARELAMARPEGAPRHTRKTRLVVQRPEGEPRENPPMQVREELQREPVSQHVDAPAHLEASVPVLFPLPANTDQVDMYPPSTSPATTAAAPGGWTDSNRRDVPVLATVITTPAAYRDTRTRPSAGLSPYQTEEEQAFGGHPNAPALYRRGQVPLQSETGRLIPLADPRTIPFPPAHAPSQIIRPPPVSPPPVHQCSLSSDAFGPAATASDLPPRFPPQHTATRDHQQQPRNPSVDTFRYPEDDTPVPLLDLSAIPVPNLDLLAPTSPQRASRPETTLTNPMRGGDALTGSGMTDEDLAKIQIGESGRAQLKSLISQKCRAQPEMKACIQSLELGKVKYACLLNLLKMVCNLWTEVLQLQQLQSAAHQSSEGHGEETGGKEQLPRTHQHKEEEIIMIMKEGWKDGGWSQ
uniref:Uncharacterized protein n=1 Tax=Chromera velia CCMP2878 TaxID=1169474 RepID=A0A0G4F4H0_9ALVE|eukprot:Cvel_14995.t1-p1 / transcript=Cvel_14995.t1 / gene=Cvel_14995 / organism=Chromera_velia_CCMP2878 / gene_product=hypothetical protein / transcript_product=hypothetical protein / location=Cvel_scaffold1091:6365-13737(-) / protein_length=708 / sequence_SO=supercontig / SO=protein_coding / is_pseudo=false